MAAALQMQCSPLKTAMLAGMFHVQNRLAALKHRLERDTQRIAEFTDRDVLRDHVDGFDDLGLGAVLLDQ